MKAVMMNPAEPVQRIVVDCGKGKPLPVEEVGRTFSGRSGGKIIITRELWAWIQQQNFALRQQRYSQKESIEKIQEMLSSKAFNNEVISLGRSTLEKIVTFKYQDMLKDGIPPQTTQLLKEEMERQQLQREGESELEAMDRFRKFCFQIYTLAQDPERSYFMGKASSAEELYELFPDVEWPRLDLGFDEMADLIESALRLKITRYRPRQEQRFYKGRPTGHTDSTQLT